MKRFLPSLVLTVPFLIGCPGGESSDDDSAAALLLLAAGGGEPTTCQWTTASGDPSSPTVYTLTIPMVTIRGSGTATVPNVSAAGSGAHWVAYRFPSVKADTKITFDFDPTYSHAPTLSGYAAGNCPIDTGTAKFTNHTGTYGATSTVDITAAGDVIFIGGPTTNPAGKTVTRTDP